MKNEQFVSYMFEYWMRDKKTKGASVKGLATNPH